MQNDKTVIQIKYYINIISHAVSDSCDALTVNINWNITVAYCMLVGAIYVDSRYRSNLEFWAKNLLRSTYMPQFTVINTR